MCHSIQLLRGNAVVREITTTAEAIEFFGAEHVWYIGDGRLEPGLRHDYCLCPIDIERIARECGYRILGMDDPRWSALDARLIKIKRKKAA